MSKVFVIGGGPAGMLAAYAAAKNGHTVTLLEKNEKLGKKLYITGKGRCNVTNASPMDDVLKNIVTNPKFLYSAFEQFDNQDMMELLEKNGLKLKVERGNRVFPESDKSSDVISCLQRILKSQGVAVLLKTEVLDIKPKNPGWTIELTNHKKLEGDAVILATGGLSYPSTGSTGDGFTFAKDLGMQMKDPSPSLVPFEVAEEYCSQLQGLSLKNVTLTITNGKKKLYSEFGEMLFTHFGISGPLVLSASAKILPKYFQDNLEAFIDLKPALDRQTLDQRLLHDFEENQKKLYKNALDALLPSKMIPVFIACSGLDPEEKVCEITKEERTGLVELFKNFPLTITGKRDFKEAIITKGGISVKEINPSTMEAKAYPGLFICGEVLDLDAYTGGYNLQIAWSTGYVAGSHIL